MRYDKRHFRKLEEFRSEIGWAQEEIDHSTDPSHTREMRAEKKQYRKELSDWRRARPGIVKAYNAFIKKGGDTLN